jgi:hypothetical protein
MKTSSLEGLISNVLLRTPKVLVFTAGDESTYDRDPVSVIHRCRGCHNWGYFDASNKGKGTHHYADASLTPK